jgi:hypothetical protein
MNPFYQHFEDHFRNELVRVHKRDESWKGTLTRLNFDEQEVIIHGTDSCFISDFDSIDLIGGPLFRRLPVDQVKRCRWSGREFSVDENTDWLQRVRRQDRVGSYPVVRETEDSYEIISGNKRLWGMRTVGIDKHLFRVVDCTLQEHALRWSVHHLEMDKQERARAISRLSEDFEDPLSVVAWEDRPALPCPKRTCETDLTEVQFGQHMIEEHGWTAADVETAHLI